MAIALCVACNRAQPFDSAQGKPPGRDVTVWHPLGAWSGRSLLQTDPFTSTTGLLRITWEARDVSSNGTGTLHIVVHSDVSGRPLADAVDHRGSGHDVAYVNEDPRAFFLLIDAKNLDWTVSVDEGLPATRRRN